MARTDIALNPPDNMRHPASSAATPDRLLAATDEGGRLSREAADTLSMEDDAGIRRTIAEMDDLSIETLRRLANDEHVRVRSALAERPVRLPKDILAALCADASERVRLAAAKNHGQPLSGEGRAALLADPDLNVLLAMARRPDLTDAEIRVLAAGGGGFLVLRALACREDLSDAACEFLARTGEQETLREIARRPSLPETAAKTILELGDREARRRLAVQTPASLEVRSRLAGDRAFLVSYCLLEDADDPATLLFLALSPHSIVRTKAISKASKSSAHEILEALEEAAALHPRRRKRLAEAAKEILGAV